MSFSTAAIQTNLEALQAQLSALKLFYQQGHDYQKMVYEHWNAKDVLGHLVFWQESFARNIRDLGLGQVPQPLKGKLSEVNQQSIESTASVSIPMLLQRLEAAQGIVEQHIFDTSIGLIPYKKGSRSYDRLEHLEVVAKHIQRHLKDLNRVF